MSEYSSPCFSMIIGMTALGKGLYCRPMGILLGYYTSQEGNDIIQNTGGKTMLLCLSIIDSPEEQEKFEKIYITYRGLMYYVANDILHNVEDSEDAVHQAFVVIAENIKNISEPLCLKTRSFVTTIAENKAIDIYRYNKRHNNAMYQDEYRNQNVERSTDDGLANCILRLPPRYRQVILLRYYQGYSCKELSKILGITLSNAIKLDQRAKNKLREFCKEEGIIC